MPCISYTYHLSFELMQIATVYYYFSFSVTIEGHPVRIAPRTKSILMLGDSNKNEDRLPLGQGELVVLEPRRRSYIKLCPRNFVTRCCAVCGVIREQQEISAMSRILNVPITDDRYAQNFFSQSTFRSRRSSRRATTQIKTYLPIQGLLDSPVNRDSSSHVYHLNHF